MQVILMICGIIPLTLFGYLIYVKLKIYKTRTALQELGLINKKRNLEIISLFELLVWFMPILFFRKIDDLSYGNLIRKADISLLTMISSPVILILVMCVQQTRRECQHNYPCITATLPPWEEGKLVSTKPLNNACK